MNTLVVGELDDLEVVVDDSLTLEVGGRLSNLGNENVGSSGHCTRLWRQQSEALRSQRRAETA